MFLEESVWVKNKLEYIKLNVEDKILDVGSSSLKYRTLDQPYIDKNIFAFLRVKGCKVTHLDRKKEEGMDIVCDIAKLDNLQNKYDLILCTNLLEHIENINKFAKDVINLLKDGGYLIITVPYNFEYHLDPIDTGYRPTTKEIEQLFSSLSVIHAESLDTSSALCHLDIIGRIMVMFKRKRYEVSCVLFRKLNKI